ncbi:MAG: hypothetical protein HGA43_13990, partial [Nitrospirae bacterium]|nr:hypothetical protein [Nitrospirota bacterium]
NNEIFVTNYNSSSITVYGRTDAGNIAPTRTISGANTGLNFPAGIALDSINNEIFVTNSNSSSITVYGRTDAGNIAPTRTISGAHTGLNFPAGIAVDTKKNEIFVINRAGNDVFTINWAGYITVYKRTDSDNIAFVRIIFFANADDFYGLCSIALW